MSFLDDNPDLNGTVFSQDKLIFFRQYLKAAIERLDPSWLEKPKGYMISLQKVRFA